MYKADALGKIECLSAESIRSQDSLLPQVYGDLVEAQLEAQSSRSNSASVL
jgi:hypothetical protein